MNREFSIVIILGFLCVVVAFIAPAFFTAANLRDVALANVPVLIAAIGMTLVIVVRQIDISIGAQFALVGLAAGGAAKAGFPMPVVVLCAIGAGAALGCINGLLVGLLRLPSIIVTLAAMAILRDAIRLTMEGAWIENLPPNFQWFGLGQTAGQTLIAATAVLLLVTAAGMLKHLAAGRAIFVTGSDAEAARLAGIDIRAVTVCVFVVMGALAGTAALLDVVRFSEIPSNSGVGLELRVIAAVVVGGASIQGGRGSILGTFLGVALLGMIGPALTFLGINPFWERAIQGLIIIGSASVDALLPRLKGMALARG